MQVDGEAIQRAERAGLQFEFQLVDRLAGGVRLDRALVECRFHERRAVEGEAARAALDVGEEHGFEPAVERRGEIAGGGRGEGSEIGLLARDRPFPFAAIGRDTAVGRGGFQCLDAAIAAAPHAQGEAVGGQRAIGRVEIARDLVPVLGDAPRPAPAPAPAPRGCRAASGA